MTAAAAPGAALSAGADWAAEAVLSAEAHAAQDRARAAEVARRLGRARALGAAIGLCEPADAVAVMSAALADLGAGMPFPALTERLRDDARYWAAIASELELVEYAGAAMDRLKDAPLALVHRKQLLVALWTGLPDAERRAFLARVDPRGTFQARRT